MRLLLTIIFFSISYAYSQAQAKWIWGKNESGKSGWYVVTALAPASTVQTSLRNKADSLKALYLRQVASEKVIKILRDSNIILTKKNIELEEDLKEARIPDTTRFLGNTKVRQIRKHYSEIEILP